MRLPTFVGLLVLILSPIAGAQAITEEAFLSAFTQESTAVRALTEGVARAEATRKRAGVLPNPRADFWREQPEASARVTNWTFSWTPPLDGRYGLGKRSADAGLAAARERLSTDKAHLRREVRAAFADWSLSHERRNVLRRQLESVQTLAEAEQQRARVGEGSGLSARRFSLAAAELRASLATADAAYAKADALARAWRPDLAPGTLPEMTVPGEPPASTDPMTSPEVRAFTFEAEQAALDSKRAGRFLTFPTLQLGWQQLGERNVTRTGPIFAAGWTIPLFDRDQGARAEAALREQIVLARLELARARVAAEVQGGAAAYRALLVASRDAAAAADEGDRVITAATAAFRAGETSITDLLDSLRAALGARLTELDLRGQTLQAHRELEAALGQPLAGGGF